MKWTHDELARDLAAHLRGSTSSLLWENMQLGPSGSIRPDVYRLERSYAHPRPCCYEIKVNRSDFLRDIGTGKWTHYFDVAEVVYFAAPEGILKRNEVPPDAGLYIRGEAGWRPVKAPRPRRLDCLPEDTCLKLLIDGIDRQTSTRIRGYLDCKQYMNEKALEQAAAKRFGHKAAGMMGTWIQFEREIADQERRTKDYRERQAELEEQHRERLRKTEVLQLARLREILKLPETADVFDIGAAVSRLSKRLSESALLEQARTALQGAAASATRQAEILTEAAATLPTPPARRTRSPWS